MARQSFTEYVELSTTGSSCEIEVTVTFFHTPACRGARESSGVPLEPDSPEEVEIVSVVTQPASAVRAGPRIDILPLLSAEVVAALEQTALEMVHGEVFA